MRWIVALALFAMAAAVAGGVLYRALREMSEERAIGLAVLGSPAGMVCGLVVLVGTALVAYWGARKLLGG